MAIVKGKRRLLLFVSSWLVLFGATILIRWIGMGEVEASTQSSSDVYKGVVRQVQEAQLASEPRKTDSTYHQASDFPQLEESLQQGMLRVADEIQACVKQTMGNSRADNEKLEISFRTKRIEGVVRPVDLILEKSTVNFDANEVECFLRHISKINLGSNPEIDTRVVYQMCIKNRVISTNK